MRVASVLCRSCCTAHVRRATHTHPLNSNTLTCTTAHGYGELECLAIDSLRLATDSQSESRALAFPCTFPTVNMHVASVLCRAMQHGYVQFAGPLAGLRCVCATARERELTRQRSLACPTCTFCYPCSYHSLHMLLADGRIAPCVMTSSIRFDR